jgi:hypothetical protein
VRYAGEAGFGYPCPEEALRRGGTRFILWKVFLKQPQKLNRGRVDHP